MPQSFAHSHGKALAALTIPGNSFSSRVAAWIRFFDFMVREMQARQAVAPCYDFAMITNAAISYEQIKDGALQLPLEDRSRLASRLLESLDDDDDVSPEWVEEIRRRVKEMKEGTAKMVPHDEVMSNVRERVAKRREDRAAVAS